MTDWEIEFPLNMGDSVEPDPPRPEKPPVSDEYDPYVHRLWTYIEQLEAENEEFWDQYVQCDRTQRALRARIAELEALSLRLQTQ